MRKCTACGAEIVGNKSKCGSCRAEVRNRNREANLKRMNKPDDVKFDVMGQPIVNKPLK